MRERLTTKDTKDTEIFVRFVSFVVPTHALLHPTADDSPADGRTALPPAYR